jgi:uncharacterized membrane protein YesL
MFSLNGTIYGICNKIYYLALLNVTFLLHCLPIVTIPSATAALFGVSKRLVQGDEEFLFQMYREMFKKHFTRSLLTGLFMAAFGAGLLINFCLLSHMNTVFKPVCFTGLCFIAIFYIITMLYLFLVSVSKSCTLKQLIIDSFTIGAYKFHMTLINVILVGAVLLISLRFSFLLMVLSFSASSYITAWFFNKKVHHLLHTIDAQEVEDNRKKPYMIM